MGSPDEHRDSFIVISLHSTHLNELGDQADCLLKKVRAAMFCSRKIDRAAINSETIKAPADSPDDLSPRLPPKPAKLVFLDVLFLCPRGDRNGAGPSTIHEVKTKIPREPLPLIINPALLSQLGLCNPERDHPGSGYIQRSCCQIIRKACRCLQKLSGAANEVLFAVCKNDMIRYDSAGTRLEARSTWSKEPLPLRTASLDCAGFMQPTSSQNPVTRYSATRSSASQWILCQQTIWICAHARNANIKRMSGSTPFAVSQLPPQDEIKILLAEEMKDRFVGPMPPAKIYGWTICRDYPGQEACPHIHEQHFRKIPEGASEKSFYTLLADAMKPFTPGFETVVAPRSTDFELMAMFLEVKSLDKHDAFADPPQDTLSKLLGEELDIFLNNWKFECDTTNGMLTRGQMIAYALTQIGCQFRQFAFSVAIIGKHARILRWDRGGAVVTERFDYTEQPGLLADFFWRFSLASAERMGLDQSLKLPTSTKLFYYGVPDDDISRAHRDDPDLTALYRYIVKDRVVYLKDTWRIDSNDMQKEGDTYRQLHGYQVPHIAPFERGNDLEGHGSRTVTHEYVEESWVCGMPFATGHVHYRMVLGVVGRELSIFRSTYELVSAVADALEAHEDAYHKAGILHRDTMGRVFSSTGICVGSAVQSKRGRHDRTGTWQFMSAALLSDPTKHQDFEDDLESFLHVLTWTAIRYCPSNLTAQERSSYLSLIFDEVQEKNGVYVGGDCKCGRLKLENLKRRSWFPLMIRAYLQNPDLTWPTDDKAERLPLGAKSTATKRQKAQNSNRINSQDAARAHSRFPGELDDTAGQKSTAKENRLGYMFTMSIVMQVCWTQEKLPVAMWEDGTRSLNINDILWAASQPKRNVRAHGSTVP
ncbi:uncharacterized protein EDB93DRAFT_1108121 [Suillus bovinus]|uniref:uncharacterized protein n=1 Tax=Suillus bovinus TaxID=48563 RepID=UPI001B876ADE|nr:uncharacterized protein EDB93DRAFT_1108121 [Suillus bovinus]KAG2131428.1 hypothetical protein EDB93DRAFT_1108121 [Suillus bovinus]